MKRPAPQNNWTMNTDQNQYIAHTFFPRGTFARLEVHPELTKLNQSLYVDDPCPAQSNESSSNCSHAAPASGQDSFAVTRWFGVSSLIPLYNWHTCIRQKMLNKNKISSYFNILSIYVMHMFACICPRVHVWLWVVELNVNVYSSAHTASVHMHIVTWRAIVLVFFSLGIFFPYPCCFPFQVIESWLAANYWTRVDGTGSPSWQLVKQKVYKSPWCCITFCAATISCLFPHYKGDSIVSLCYSLGYCPQLTRKFVADNLYIQL